LDIAEQTTDSIARTVQSEEGQETDGTDDGIKQSDRHWHTP
jgi:hypothetical protein